MIVTCSNLRIFNEGSLKGLADITINSDTMIIIRGVRIIASKDCLFVTIPQSKTVRTILRDASIGQRCEFKKAISVLVLMAYAMRNIERWYQLKENV